MDLEPGNGSCNTLFGVCTLRAALQEANDSAARDTISFEDVPTTDGFAPISLDSDLGTLEVTEEVFIDGSTAPGYPSASADGPIVKVDGSNIAGDILRVRPGADGSRVEGLAFVDGPARGISVIGEPAPENISIFDCFVGIDVDGTTVQGNGSDGIFVGGNESSVNGALVSGNGEDGILISGSNHTFFNNIVGLDHDADASKENAGHGVHVAIGSGNVIGDVSDIFLSGGNTIAANENAGVFIEGDNNTVNANLIGTNGSSAFPNSTGIAIEGSSSNNPAEGNQIGSGDDIDQNTISGNQFNGIRLGNGASNRSANNNIINNNKIGTGSSGTNAVPNGNGSVEGGIRIDEGAGNEILNNVISGNNANGIRIRGPSTGNTITGNRIGVDVDNNPLGNNHWGIWVQSDFSNIGGFSSGEENIIGANANAGIRIEGNSNSIFGNFVGVTSGGMSIGNGANGIFVGGDNTKVRDNKIGNNSGAGIQLTNASETSIVDNHIGTNASGDAAPNGREGIFIEATSNNSAVGNAITSAVEVDLTIENANVIANNQGDGVRIGGDGTTLRNAVRGNRIFNNTELGLDLGDDEATSNDAGDGDDGPNRLQNFPELEASTYDPDTEEATVTYLVPSDPNVGTDGASTYPIEIDIFAADADDEEGKEYLGTDTYSSVSPNDYAGCGSPPCTVTVAFTPESSLSQGDEIVATATDDNGNTSEFSASVTVESLNDPPVAEDDSDQTEEGQSVTTDVLANDTDPDGDLAPSTVQVEQGPSDGTITGVDEETGAITYAPDDGFAGPDSYTYTVADTEGARSGEATVTIEVTENDPPTASFTFEPGVPEVGKTVDFDASDSEDSDGTITDYRWDFDDDGQVDETGQTATFTYQESGDKPVTLTVEDDDGATNSATETVPVNAPPVAEDDSDQTEEGQSVTTDVLANDTDPDGDLDPSTVAVQNPPSDGSITDVDGSTGAITYEPDGGFSGTDSYTYTVEDDNGAESNEVTVTVSVNAPPTASFNVDPRVPGEGETVTFDGSNSSDPDGTVEAYRWDFDNDGQTDATGPTASTSFTSAGEKTVVLAVEDEDGATDEAVTGIAVRRAQIQVSVARTFETRQTEDYRLVALPGRVEQTLSATVSGFWRGFREEGTTGSRTYSRSECNGECGLGSGKGFWLIATESWQVDQTAQTSPLEEDGTVRLVLQDGWNIVSNPLEVDVPWSAVQEATGTNQPLWRWEDGRWEKAETFQSAERGVAYYFMDDQVSELAVPFSVPEDVSARAEEGAPGVEESGRGERQPLTLSIIRDTTSSSSVEVGVRSGATEGLDRFDVHGPPGYFGQTTLRLTEEKGKRRYALVAEYQGPGGKGHSFDMVLQAPPDTAVTLQASGIGTFAEQEILLVERATGRSHDLRKRPEMRVVPRAEELRFRLLVGSRSFVEEERRKITPEEVKLMPNYPNPFRKGTTIEYALPEVQHVRLAVYDALGRRVEVLVEEQQRAGFHRVQWRDGAELSSGMYFYRLRLDEKTKVRRMTVVR